MYVSKKRRRKKLETSFLIIILISVSLFLPKENKEIKEEGEGR